MNNAELIQKLEELPAEIRYKSTEILNKIIEIDTIQERITSIKVNAMEKVLETGAATNDKARTTAQAKILETDELYQGLNKTLQANQISVRYEQAQLEFLHHQLRVYLAIAGMMSNPAVY